MSYRKSSKSQYERKPAAWVAGYWRKGRYVVWQKQERVPISADLVNLVVPVETQKDLQLPIGCRIVHRFKGGPKNDERIIVEAPREMLRNFDVRDAVVDVPAQPQPKIHKTVTEYDQQIGVIRKALKKLCPTLSVRRGSGTAYGWIDILGSGEFNNFTDQEKQALDKFGLGYGMNAAVISPEAMKYYVEKAQKML